MVLVGVQDRWEGEEEGEVEGEHTYLFDIVWV